MMIDTFTIYPKATAPVPKQAGCADACQSPLSHNWNVNRDVTASATPVACTARDLARLLAAALEKPARATVKPATHRRGCGTAALAAVGADDIISRNSPVHSRGERSYSPYSGGAA
jgi:hypothetical protein